MDINTSEIMTSAISFGENPFNWYFNQKPKIPVEFDSESHQFWTLSLCLIAHVILNPSWALISRNVNQTKISSTAEPMESSFFTLAKIYK